MSEIDNLVNDGSKLVDDLEKQFRTSTELKLGLRNVIFREPLLKEEKVYCDLQQKYVDYTKRNIEKQKYLVTIGSINDRLYRSGELQVVKSQKETLEFILGTLEDLISSHRDYINNIASHIIAFAALLIAVLSAALSFIWRN